MELVAREKNILKVKGFDTIDGMPVLDIKLYSPYIDERKTSVRLGWLEDKLKMERA